MSDDATDRPATDRRSTDPWTVIKGRRWRVSDPELPPDLRQELVDELMAARRAVKTAKGAEDDDALRAARARVQDAKVALGERGAKWWERPSPTELDERAAAARRALQRARGDDATVADDEVARIVAGADFGLPGRSP